MKKTISILLVISLLMGLLSLVSFAASAETAAIAITGVGEPVVGEALSVEGITGIPEGFTAESRWAVYNYEVGTFISCDEGAVCADNSVYKLHIDLTAQDAACIPFDDVEVLNNATVNGALIDNWGNYDSNDIGYTEVYLEKIWSLGDITVIDQLEITQLPVCEAGTSMDTSVVQIPENAGYVLGDCDWYTEDPWERVEADGSLEEDQAYTLYVYLKPAEGYWISSDAELTTPMPVRGSYYDLYNGKYAVSFFYDLRPEQLTEVTLSGMPESITAGAATVPQVAVEGESAAVKSVAWVDAEYNAVDKLEDGKLYYLAVELTPADGYEFRDWVEAYGDDRWNSDYTIGDGGESATVYFYYSLLPQIEKVELTVSGVEVGKNVTDIKVTVPNGAKYICEDVYVYNCDEDWQQVEEGTFQNKVRYQVEFYLQPVEGYEFAEEMTVLVNGEDIEDNYYGDFDYVWVYEYHSFKTKIDKIDLTVTEPKIGGNVADSVVKAPEGANYEVAYWWYDITADGQITEGTFQDKHKYVLSFDVYPKEGYEFSIDAVITLNGAEPEHYYVNEYSGSYGYAYETWSYLTPIAKVEFPAFPEMKVGDSAELEIKTPEGVNYTLDYGWTNMTSDEYPETLENGNVYVLDYYAEAAEGFEFTDDTVITVGGKEYSGLTENYGSEIAIGKAYSFGMKLIDKVELTVTEPANGAKPGKLEVANKDANYYIDYSNWGTNTTGDIDDDAKNFKTFQYGNYYFVGGYLYADEGYAFADDVKFYINGKEVELVQGFNVGTVYIAVHGFGKLVDPATVTPETDGTGSTETPPASNPQTGDETPIVALVALLVLAAAGVTVTVIGKKKYAK